MKGPWTLPNFITLLRLAALPFFLVAISDGSFGIALAIFVAAGLSDGIDGFLARRFDMKSALGAYLDPIADKLMLMSSYLFLAIPSYPALVKVPVWLAVMVISRDFLLMLVALLMILSSSRKRFPAELERQSDDGHADHHRALRALRQHLGLAAPDSADRLRRGRDVHHRSRGSTTSTGPPRAPLPTGRRSVDPPAPPEPAGLPPLRSNARGGRRNCSPISSASGKSSTSTPIPSSPAATAKRSRSSSSTAVSSPRCASLAWPAVSACAARPA